MDCCRGCDYYGENDITESICLLCKRRYLGDKDYLTDYYLTKREENKNENLKAN